MKHLRLAAVALMAMAGFASAQSAETLRAQLSGQVMDLRGYDNAAQNRTGEIVRLRLFESGAAHVRFNAFDGDDGVERWMLWRVTSGGQFCTTFATQNAQGVLRATDSEDCLDIAVQGNRVGLNFYSNTGGFDRYSGTLRPM